MAQVTAPTESAETDSVSGAGVIKAQVQSKSVCRARLHTMTANAVADFQPVLQLSDIGKRVRQMLSATNPASQRDKLENLQLQASAEGFWDQQDKAAAVNQEMSDINEMLDLAAQMQSQLEDVQTAVELIDMEVTFEQQCMPASSCV